MLDYKVKHKQIRFWFSGYEDIRWTASGIAHIAWPKMIKSTHISSDCMPWHMDDAWRGINRIFLQKNVIWKIVIISKSHFIKKREKKGENFAAHTNCLCSLLRVFLTTSLSFSNSP